jgi:hypothetical protein
MRQLCPEAGLHFPKRAMRRAVAAMLLIMLPARQLAQEGYRYLAYNTLIGGITGGIGSLINRTTQEKKLHALTKGFITGMAGGAVMYAGKRANSLIIQMKEPGWAWISRTVFCAGNSVVENASANRPFWQRWHYDFLFARVEADLEHGTVRARLMPSAFAGFVILAAQARPDWKNSLASGTAVFIKSGKILSPGLSGLTAGNSIVILDTVQKIPYFRNVLAHEMVHTFQFQEWSGVNGMLLPLHKSWTEKSPRVRQLSKWIYGDINYEIMLLNYFIVQRGYSPEYYFRNYYEREAEMMSTGTLPVVEDQ